MIKNFLRLETKIKAKPRRALALRRSIAEDTVGRHPKANIKEIESNGGNGFERCPSWSKLTTLSSITIIDQHKFISETGVLKTKGAWV